MKQSTTTITTATYIATLFAALIVLECGENPSGLTWYCGREKTPRTIKATLINGTLTIRGKGVMRNYRDTRGIIIDVFVESWSKSDHDRAMKEYRIDDWPPWYFTFIYDSTISITRVVVEEGVTHIGNLAFACLPELKSITIPASVSSIGKGALGDRGGYTMDNCISGITSITVAADNAHYSSDDNVLFDKSKTSLILYPISKQGPYTIPNNVTTIREEAFRHSIALTSITIPNSMTSIEKEAFGDCTNLTSIAFPNSITSIGDGAFILCSNLTSITIPNSVTSIGDEAFRGCKNLTSVTTLNHSPPAIGNDTFYSIPQEACLYVPSGSIDTYRNTNGWNTFKCIKDITAIGGS